MIAASSLAACCDAAAAAAALTDGADQPEEDVVPQVVDVQDGAPTTGLIMRLPGRQTPGGPSLPAGRTESAAGPQPRAPSSALLPVAPSFYESAAGTGGCWDFFFFLRETFKGGRVGS